MRKAQVGGAALVREWGLALDGAQHTDAQIVQMCRDRQSRTTKGNSSNCPARLSDYDGGTWAITVGRAENIN